MFNYYCFNILYCIIFLTFTGYHSFLTRVFFIFILFFRFYDVKSGSITIDGINICDLDPHWLRSSAIGIINQEPVLFATTIKENIMYGKPNATDEEVNMLSISVFIKLINVNLNRKMVMSIVMNYGKIVLFYFFVIETDFFLFINCINKSF